MRVIGQMALAATVFGVVAASDAQAVPVTTTPQTASLGLTTTNYSQTLSVFKFNSSLGTLTDVFITLNGTVVATLKAESLDAAAATITITDVATQTLTALGGTLSLAQVLPTASINYAAAAFDGTLDFLGTSGKTQAGVTGTATSGLLDLTSASILAAFTGSGAVDPIALALGATASAAATGTGNIASSASTQASGDISVSYRYNPAAPVPEPASM
ncbi:MAG: choice-of-anchor E domain-containing protein, partial [Alphaproteobacteria bacterium]|nr:choice-of-anchor E domain-containing protein [Alphaproteobacteria bacterium]